KFEIKEWILCIPRVIDIDENTWWFRWKHRQLQKYTKNDDFIKLVNGNELIDLFKEWNLYNRFFQIENSEKIDEIYKHLIPQKIIRDSNLNPSVILFNNYDIKNEPYYLHRESDTQFNSALEFSNIWLFGKSGNGKTALVNRNLIQNKIQYCYCDLSPVTIEKYEDVFLEILFSIEEMFNIKRNIDETNLLKQISKILCHNKLSKIVVVIDELAVYDEVILQKIADSFIQLVTFHSKQSSNDDLKFIVTIASCKT
ncbi:MAG: hypothetical protein LC122_15565, partial [Chitinophagales bacterium]|nr:hypothetical protein [Chitinophagales bacterium]